MAVVGGFILMPELFFDYPNRGLSHYGNYWPTLVPFAIGFSFSIACLVLAAYFLPDQPRRLGIMRRLLLAMAFGLAVILLTPDQANLVFYWSHTFAAIYLFVVAGGGAIWVMMYAGRTQLDWFLLAALVFGSILSLLSASYVRVLGVLALGQVLALSGGPLIIIRGAMRWVGQEAKG